MRSISVRGVSKEFIIGRSAGLPPDTIKDALSAAVRSPFRRFRRLRGDAPQEERFLALDSVDFEIGTGEVAGIIGRNGAGKSTLLKILSGITEPTSGRVELYGRTGSLLEVGTGFHPELTGRENIFLNGTLLGMKKAEILRKFDAIVAFSEVEKFIDTPLKHYSSGMYVRLAFSIAAHLDPEILIVDEVLAVGDARFQMKCIGRIGEIVQEGRTVLVVSHNMQVIQTLCSRAIWLDEGKVAFDGSPREAVVAYSSSYSTLVLEQAWEPDGTAPGNEAVRLRRVRVVPEDATDAGLLTIRTPFRMEFDFRLAAPIPLFYVSFHFRSVNGEIVFRSASSPMRADAGDYASACHVPGDLLNNGKFAVDLYFMRDGSSVVHRTENALVFEVYDVEREPGGHLGDLPGFVRPTLRWDVAPAT